MYRENHVRSYQSIRLQPSRVLILLCAAIGFVALARSGTPGEPSAVLPPLNQKVLQFALAKLGSQVGNGECTTLALEAFKHAGARRFRFQGSEGDYVWGRPIDSFRAALPGDVLQFRDAVFEGKRWINKRRWESWKHEYPHHTAIVAEVRDSGRVVAMLHQNIGPDDAPDAEKKLVQETIIRPESLRKGGRVRIYRPISLDEPQPPDGTPTREAK
jgi:hypothetical protein